MVFDCIIIGAGASGSICAIKASVRGKKVLLLEHKDRILKKLLVTGNGRCNFTNVNATFLNYTANNMKLLEHIFKKYNPSKIIGFFHDLGIYSKVENNGKVYPRSFQAASMVDAIRLKLDALGVKIVTEYKIASISKKDNVFCVNNEYYAKKIVLSTGGLSYANLGSDGSGYTIAKKFKHSITKTFPILVQLKTEKDYVKGLEGIRQDVNLEIKYKGKKIRDEFGELLFTPYGISGPTIFNMSYLLPKYGFNLDLYVDFLPEIDEATLLNELKFRKENLANYEATEFLNGLVHKKLGMFLLKKCGIEKLNVAIYTIEEKIIEKLITNLKKYHIKCFDTMGYSNAQVTAGGLNSNEVSIDLESKKEKDLYFTGEILDVYGECGGYNLQFAFASGLLVGENI